jgi:hypothetical protein
MLWWGQLPPWGSCRRVEGMSIPCRVRPRERDIGLPVMVGLPCSALAFDLVGYFVIWLKTSRSLFMRLEILAWRAYGRVVAAAEGAPILGSDRR